ncbi:MAG: Abi family protein [Clostridium sp.]|nr:Abi family protein [Clostridium sp.]MCM1207798.1 Abi family protein [Ruminococcus sp.]
MTSIPINYTTPEQQIIKLKKQNLIIEDEENAKRKLQIYGYSNLIKSYREPYVVTNGNEKSYRSGVTFNQIESLYLLDKALRNAMMAAMQDLEEHIKESTADVLAKTFGTHQDEYLNFKNFRDKKKTKKRFSLGYILTTLRDMLQTDKYPIHHYSTKYGTVPPWILLKSAYFSTIVNFISLFKVPEQENLCRLLYDLSEDEFGINTLRMLMMDTLFICVDYRNKAAHGGRIYNYKCSSTLRVDKLSNIILPMEPGLGQFLYLLSLLKYPAPYKRLKSVLDKEVNRHCNRFPQDVTYLGQILNMNIVSKEYVFVSPNSNKYHTTPHCSGLHDALKLEKEEAEQNQFVPCKRCFK